MDGDVRSHIIRYLSKGIRYDGRKTHQFRDIVVEKGVVANAEGSARVKIGDTEVIAGVKMIVDKPYPDAPDQGTMMVGAELLPLSNPDFEMGPPGIKAIELARVVDRGIRESNAIDVKKLCIKEGEKVWIISVDICTINDSGNLFDASSLATLIAIQDAKFPKYDEELDVVEYGEMTDEPIPMEKLPISVTVLKIGKNLIVDPTLEEENVLDGRLSVASLEDGTLCAMQKGGLDPLTSEDINAMISLAVNKAAEIRKKL